MYGEHATHNFMTPIMNKLLGCNDLFSRLSSRFYFWKNRLRRRTQRRTVMGTTDRRGCLVPKHLEFRKLGAENNSLNFATTWQDGLSWARRTDTGPLVKVSL